MRAELLEDGVRARFEALVPRDVRDGWVAVADELEARRGDLADLIGRVRRAIAGFNVASVDLEPSDEEFVVLLEVSGLGRLDAALDALGLGSVTDDLTLDDCKRLAVEVGR